MPFGLNGDSATSQRYINGALCETLDGFCSTYMDDILIYTDGSLLEHEKHVNMIFQTLKNAVLGLDLDKCEFSVRRTKYLAFIISGECSIPSISMDQENIRAISKWQAPTTTNGL